MKVVGYVITGEQYRSYSNEFHPVQVVSRSLGSSLGSVWEEVLSEGYSIVSCVEGFVFRGSDVYALLSDSYVDSFNFIEWVNSHVDFPLKEKITPFNYKSVFGEGYKSRPVEEVISEIESQRSSLVNYDSYEVDEDSATSIISEEFYSLTADGISFSVFEDGREYSLGRGSGSDFPVVARGISRNHLKMKVFNGVLQIYDLGSTNGTRINGSKIRQLEWVDVHSGSSIRVGKITINVDKVEE